MAQITKRVQAHYESREVPFGKTYEWFPTYMAIECNCGEKLTLSATSTLTTCHRCGADLGALVRDIKEEAREGHSPDKLTHPWFYDAKERAAQHQQDIAAYPAGSPWRYNDITGDP